MCEQKIDTIYALKEMSKKLSSNETQTSEENNWVE